MTYTTLIHIHSLLEAEEEKLRQACNEARERRRELDALADRAIERGEDYDQEAVRLAGEECRAAAAAWNRALDALTEFMAQDWR